MKVDHIIVELECILKDAPKDDYTLYLAWSDGGALIYSFNKDFDEKKYVWNNRAKIEVSKNDTIDEIANTIRIKY